MPAYNFKERFASYVAGGSKRQTVRAVRKGKAKNAYPGEPLYLFSGMRTRNCVRLGEARCSQKDEIIISKFGIQLRNTANTDDWQTLDETDRDLFAWNDGFRHSEHSREGTPESYAGCWNLMFRYWWKENGLPWRGEVIYWDNFVSAPVKLKPAAL